MYVLIFAIIVVLHTFTYHCLLCLFPGSFLVCWLPYLGAHVWMTTVRNLSHAEESMPYIMEFVVMCVALTNGLINPVVIMLSNRDYRKEIKIIFSHRFSSMEERSDTDSITFHSRRSHTLSKTFQPEIKNYSQCHTSLLSVCCQTDIYVTSLLSVCRQSVVSVLSVCCPKQLFVRVVTGKS